MYDFLFKFFYPILNLFFKGKKVKGKGQIYGQPGGLKIFTFDL